jgi:lysozyme family protein
MTRYEECLAWLEPIEGGYCCRRDDRGGATNHGVTQTTYDAWRARMAQPSVPVEYIVQPEVEAIYRTMYWELAHCDVIPQPFDLYLFDSVVQHGLAPAVRLMQRLCGTTVDGVLGPNTMKAIHDDVSLMDTTPQGHELNIKAAIAYRTDLYRAIVDAHPEQQANWNGWMNRMAALEKEMLR